MYLRQEQLLFLPTANASSAQASLQGSEWSTTRAGTKLRGWLLKASSAEHRPLILYFGGNAQDISLSAANTQPTANHLYVNYRGYGSSEGEPAERELQADALHIYDQAAASVPHNGNVIAHGRSLGSGLATYLAAHRPITAVILVTPFDSIAHVARRHYPWLPVDWLLEHRFDSAALAPAISAPALFLLAGQDRVIAPLHSQALAGAWGGPIEIRQFPSATHNSIGGSAEFRTHVDRFIARFY
jgi:pimeloyl-ACP methyl ester carboxylesterase